MITRRPLEDRLRMSGNEDALAELNRLRAEIQPADWYEQAISAAKKQGALEALG